MLARIGAFARGEWPLPRYWLCLALTIACYAVAWGLFLYSFKYNPHISVHEFIRLSDFWVPFFVAVWIYSLYAVLALFLLAMWCAAGRCPSPWPWALPTRLLVAAGGFALVFPAPTAVFVLLFY